MGNVVSVIFIMCLTTIGYVATDIYLPSLPAITQYFQTTNTMVQLTLPVYLLSFAISPLFFGPYSDKVGRRKVIIPGLFLGLSATFAITLAPSIYWLIIGRLIQGFGLGAVNVAARAMIPDMYQGKQMAKLTALSGMVIPIILSSVPPLGGILQELYDWQVVFYGLFAYIGIVTISSLFFLNESNYHLKTDISYLKAFRDYKTLFLNVGFMVYALIPSFTMLGINAYLTASPYLFQHSLGLSPSEYGYISFAIGSTIVIGSIVNINLINYVTSEKILYISAVMVLSSALLLALLHYTGNVSTLYVILACMTYFFSLNFSFANAITLAYRHISGNFGTAAAWVASLQMLMGMIASSVISILPDNDVIPMMLLFAIAGIGILVLTCIGHRYSTRQGA